MVTNSKKPVKLSPLAGKPAPKEMLVDPTRLEREALVVPFLAAGYGLGRVLLWFLPAVQKGGG